MLWAGILTLWYGLLGLLCARQLSRRRKTYRIPVPQITKPYSYEPGQLWIEEVEVPKEKKRRSSGLGITQSSLKSRYFDRYDAIMDEDFVRKISGFSTGRLRRRW